MDTTGCRFIFQKRNEKIDWRKLAAVDVDKVALEVDVDAIQDNILSVTYCNIEHELGYHGLDPNFTKLFRLSQLMIEYLLHCQQYLQSCLEEKQKEINSSMAKIQETANEETKAKEELVSRNESYKALKKELQKAKKQIGDYQLMIRAGASGLHKCSNCNKSFVSEYFLNSHIERRHPEEARKHPMSPQSVCDTDVQNELAGIRARLHMTESELRTERDNIQRLRLAESERNEQAIRDLRSEHLVWKNKEQHKLKLEMEQYKDMMMSEMKQMQEDKKTLEKNIIQMEKDSGKKKSNLGNLVDADENESKYEELFAKVASLEVNFQRQLAEIQEENKTKNALRRRKYHSVLNTERKKLEEAEKERLKENQHYQNQIQALTEKLAKHEEMVKKTKVPRDFVDSSPVGQLSPVIRPPIESVTTSPMLPVATDPGYPCFWVSSNSRVAGSYRVTQHAASTKGEWTDHFTFYAPLRAEGLFDQPVHVHTSGGSPYWRQYISSESTPPNTNYKHELTFYTSRNKLVGATKVYVHQSGSANVVRSMIAKREFVERWHHRGHAFYVLKTTPKKSSFSRSGLLSSDLYTSVSDDVSVSSFDGTNEAKESLATALKISRENILEDSAASKEKSVSAYENVKAETRGDASRLDGTSSSSILGSTFPDKGEFYPYPNNQLAKAVYEPRRELLDAQRQEIEEILEDNLKKYGVPADEPQMPTSVFDSKMKHHGKETRLKEKSMPGFTQMREAIRRKVDEFCMNEWLKKKRAKAERQMKSAANAVRATVRLKRQSPRQEGTPRRVPYTKDLESVSSTENEVVLKHYEVEGFSDEENVEGSDESLRGEKDDSESSEWESEGVASQHEAGQKHDLKEDSSAEDEAGYNPKMRSPRGAKVRELAASLEASLSLRDPKMKKLAGSIDLHKVDDGIAKKLAFHQESFDDESDFSVTSFDEPQNEAAHSKKKDSTFCEDDDIDDILAAYNDKPSSSSTPHAKPTSSQTKVPPTIVTAFVDDDEDSL